MLKHEISRRGEVLVLRVQEENLDAITVSSEGRSLVDQVVDQQVNKVVVDISEVKTIDSSGVAVIVSLFKRLRAVGGGVRVAGLHGQPKEIFHFLRLDQALPIFASVDDAAKNF
jgi:anti-sigma B factor antagonist